MKGEKAKTLKTPRICGESINYARIKEDGAIAATEVRTEEQAPVSESSLKHAQVRSQQAEWKRQLKEAEKQIEELLDRLVDTDVRTVAKKLEERIDRLERQKFVLAEKASKPMPTRARLEECMELALKFLSSPWNIYKNGSYAVKQTVLKLAFAEPPKYCRVNGYGTLETSFPFKVLGSIAGPNSGLCGEMVPPERLELPTL